MTVASREPAALEELKKLRLELRQRLDLVGGTYTDETNMSCEDLTAQSALKHVEDLIASSY